ncbi:MFS general substrate transporter [Ceratobasidium sp. AG-I]|nr:MFS general substrate transporter [Ceratobasidium sp. AG-I]
MATSSCDSTYLPLSEKKRAPPESDLPPQPTIFTLLHPSEPSTQEKPSPEPTPLPRLQVSILLLMLLSEPCTAAVLLPFINNLVYEVGITHGDKSKVGYYAGLIESLFFMTESLCILQYGRLSDRIGRRPVLFFGLGGLVLSSLCFGVSTSFAGVIVSRALAGALNGNAGVIKSVLGEVTDDTNAPQAFAFIPLVWSIGFTLAPMVGGLLQHPAETMPRVFGSSLILKAYPYLLPCMVIALVPACALVSGWFFLEEVSSLNLTHPTLGRTTRSGYYHLVASEPSPSTLPSPTDISSTKPKPPPLRALLTTRVCTTILNYALLSLIDISLVALQPIVLASPISLGGLDLPPSSVGIVLAVQGVVTGVATTFLLPRIQRRFGMQKMYRAGVCLYLVQIWALWGMKYTVGTGAGMWMAVGLYACISCASPITFCCLLLYISAAPPDEMSLGATNGLAQTSASVMRAIGPAITTSLFAYSANRGGRGGSMVYIALTVVSLLCVGASMLMRAEWSTNEARQSRRSSTLH